MKSTKILRKTHDKMPAEQLIETSTKSVQVVVGRRSLKPMKSMIGIKSFKPSNLSEQLIRRK